MFRKAISIICAVLFSLPLYSMDDIARKSSFVYDTTQQISSRSNLVASVFQSRHTLPGLQSSTPSFQHIDRQQSLQSLINQAKEYRTSHSLDSMRSKLQELATLRSQYQTLYSSSSQNKTIAKSPSISHSIRSASSHTYGSISAARAASGKFNMLKTQKSVFINKHDLSKDFVYDVINAKPENLKHILEQHGIDLEQSADIIEELIEIETELVEARKNFSVATVQYLYSKALASKEEFTLTANQCSPVELAQQHTHLIREKNTLSRNIKNNRMALEKALHQKEEYLAKLESYKGFKGSFWRLLEKTVWTGIDEKDVKNALMEVEERIEWYQGRVAECNAQLELINEKIEIYQLKQADALTSYKLFLQQKTTSDLEDMAREQHELFNEHTFNSDFYLAPELLQAHQIELQSIEETLLEKRFLENLKNIYEKYCIDSEAPCERDADIQIQERQNALKLTQNQAETSTLHYNSKAPVQSLLKQNNINIKEFCTFTGNPFAVQLRKEQCTIIDQVSELKNAFAKEHLSTQAKHDYSILELSDEKLDATIQSSTEFIDHCLTLTTEATILAQRATESGHLEQAEQLNNYSWSMINLCKSFMQTTIECATQAGIGFFVDGPKNIYELGKTLDGLVNLFGQSIKEIAKNPRELLPAYGKAFLAKSKELACKIEFVSRSTAQMLFNVSQAEMLVEAGLYQEAEILIDQEAKRFEPFEKAIETQLHALGQKAKNLTLPKICRHGAAFISEGLITGGMVKIAGKTLKLARVGATRCARAIKELEQQSIESFGQRELLCSTSEGLLLQVRDKSLNLAQRTANQPAEKIVGKVTRNIQTMRLRIEKLEKYMVEKLAKLTSPVFEKANLKHLFGIDKIVKERASGAFDAKYLGYHHDKGWKLVKKGKVKFLTKPRICPKTGMVTVDRLTVEGVLIKDKTFFPPNWSRHKVIDKIVEASKNIIKAKTEGTRKILFGKTGEGMHIKLVIDENKKLITSFPILEL